MEAYLYEKLSDKKVKCNLCGHRCIIKDGKRGICAVRENKGGVLESLVYGKLIAQNIDPIEKKPLFHFLPGTLSYSISTVGCNFRCQFCQNSSIAQMPADYNGMIKGVYTLPDKIVKQAEIHGCKSISYTYTEPCVYLEYALDTAKAAYEKGIKNVFVTNGYMTTEALKTAAPFIDAANVDLKAFSDSFYKEICFAKRSVVMDTLKLMKSLNILVEVTTLIIPNLNDDLKEIKSMAEFIAGELGDDTPWHISRFHPAYKMIDQPRTPFDTLIKIRDIGIDAGLKYVYTGNVPLYESGYESESTFCPGCGKRLIQRIGFEVIENVMDNGRCPACDTLIYGIWR